MLFCLKISRILSHELSPHGLELGLTFDPTFTKHELLFVLSSYSKYCHTSPSSPARAIFVTVRASTAPFSQSKEKKLFVMYIIKEYVISS